MPWSYVFTRNYKAAHEAGHAISAFFIIQRNVVFASIKNRDAQGRTINPCIRYVTTNNYNEERFFAAGIAGVAFSRSRFVSQCPFPINAALFLSCALGSSDDIKQYHRIFGTGLSGRSIKNFYWAIKEAIEEINIRHAEFERIKNALFTHEFLSRNNFLAAMQGNRIDTDENELIFARTNFFD